MKDTYSSSTADQTAGRGDRMVPVPGSFTRPRRFGNAEPQDAEMIVEAPPTARKLAAANGARTAAPDMPRDLWGMLHQQDPGTDQHILDGSQAAEDFRSTEVSRAFDLLRTRLRQTLKLHGWINVAVVSPTARSGTTFIAANLAASLSRVPSSRTVLMDFNMRTPGLAQALDMTANKAHSLRDFLAGDVAISDYMVRSSETLALGIGTTPEGEAAEILQDPACAASLREMRDGLRPDIVLYDMPPLLAYDDTAAFLSQLDGVLLVSDGTKTMAKHITECERILDGQVPLLGVILNRARASSIERF